MTRQRRHTYKPNGYNRLHDLDGGDCAYCGEPATCIDHVMPISKGGPNTIDNTVLACTSCNARKAAKLDIDMISRGFFVILSRGGDLGWVDGQSLRCIKEEQAIYEVTAIASTGY